MVVNVCLTCVWFGAVTPSLLAATHGAANTLPDSLPVTPVAYKCDLGQTEAYSKT